MTDQEAVAKAEQELCTSVYLGEISRSPGMRTIHTNRTEWLSRVVVMAKKYLALQQVNDTPLTIDELKAIHGEPIYIKPHGWRICYGVDPAEIHGGVEKVNFGNGCYLALSGYGTQWLPYHQKPNQEETKC